MKKGEIAVRVTQADLNGMENERNRLRNTVTQLAEENKGLLLLQESAQRQLEDAKIKILNYESESKELKSRLQHADNIAEELHQAQDRIYELKQNFDLQSGDYKQQKVKFDQRV